MNILIIGGTKFVGRALTTALLNEGHNVTLFHRGNTNPDIFPEVERVFGDRERELHKLSNRNWDAVIDTCGYTPRIVKLATSYLKDKVTQYVFISTVSVYSDSDEIQRNESASLIKLSDPDNEELSGKRYGGLKVLCEAIVSNYFPENHLIIRSGLIVGPHDPTNRFTYWVTRFQQGGNILAPGEGDDFIQFIDVRDLAEFIIKMINQRKTGIFNVTGPREQITLKNLFNIIAEVLQSDYQIHWISEEFLLKKNVGQWIELPLWFADISGKALMQTSIKKALENGIQFRDLKTTILDTMAWYQSIKGMNLNWPAGLTPEKEDALLNEFQNTM